MVEQIDPGGFVARLSGTFEECFAKAVGQVPFPFQSRFSGALPEIVDIPTGLGKTAMVLIGWLWRRNSGSTKGTVPRRLVYCLPMRALVEQTRSNAETWLKNLGLSDVVDVHVLMGGEEQADWDTNPERDAIIIGTQDMLISRALNRGYAASRARWPMQFGLLHTDCLWVFDEIQLMGSGLATTAQLEAFRRLLPCAESDSAKSAHGCRSIWMSATMRPDWLATVDFKHHLPRLHSLKLEAVDLQNVVVQERVHAKKPLRKVSARMGDPSAIAKAVRATHKPATLTIVVVNTVKRACELFEALEKSKPKKEADAKLVLLHSRFRALDRKARMADVIATPTGAGSIIVSTQVIEAGVDIDAATLFTELAPWSSLVQRFGRCNRVGKQNDTASIQWVDLPSKKPEDSARPYELASLEVARAHLAELKDVGLLELATAELALDDVGRQGLFPCEQMHVIRRKDLVDLFDTTPDLAGNDIDIDRYVREIEETDVRVLWRDWERPKGYEAPPADTPAPSRDELCSAPVREFREFAKAHKGDVWRWSFLDEKWEKVDGTKVGPGQVYLVHGSAGGYLAECGWNSVEKRPVLPVKHESGPSMDANSADPLSGTPSAGVWQTISQHTDEVCAELEPILDGLALSDSEKSTLRVAARWHDFGKAHKVFQSKLPNEGLDAAQLWAKAPGRWKRGVRNHFRHELASALAVLQPRFDLGDADRDLVAYIIAAHHGKVRLSIRSFPSETRPAMSSGVSPRFARGVWDNDRLPATQLGHENGTAFTTPEVTLSLEPMELGLCEEEPFIDQPSWCERMIRLRETIGPFRLAYLETLLRAADMRASKKAEELINA